MALKYGAYIFLFPGFDPKKHVALIESDELRYKTIGIDMQQKEKAIEVAQELVAEGVQFIELCGGFGPLWIAKISEAINGVIPVGGVFYGPEARKPMLEILS